MFSSNEIDKHGHAKEQEGKNKKEASKKTTPYREKLKEVYRNSKSTSSIFYDPKREVKYTKKGALAKRQPKNVDRGGPKDETSLEYPLPLIMPLGSVIKKVVKDSQVSYQIIKPAKMQTEKEGHAILRYVSVSVGDGTVGYHIINDARHLHETIASTSVSGAKGTKIPRTSPYPTPIQQQGIFKYRETDIDFDKGHGIDHQHGNEASTLSPENYTPQDITYNRHIRNGLIDRINSSYPNGYYSEIAVYHFTNFKHTKNKTPIPEGFIFNIMNQDLEFEESYFFPNWNLQEEYNRCTKQGDESRTATFIKRYRIKNMEILKPIIYESKMTYDDYLKAVWRKVLEAEKILDEGVSCLWDKTEDDAKEASELQIRNQRREAKEAFFNFIVLNLLEQAANIEYDSTFHRCRLVGILLGLKRMNSVTREKKDSTIHKNSERVRKWLRLIEEQTIKELELLSVSDDAITPEENDLIEQQMEIGMEYRQHRSKSNDEKCLLLIKKIETNREALRPHNNYWSPEQYKKMFDQMVDLLRLYKSGKHYESKIKAIHNKLVEEQKKAREEGFIVLPVAVEKTLMHTNIQRCLV